MFTFLLVGFLALTQAGNPCAELVTESIFNEAYSAHFYEGAINEESLIRHAKINTVKTKEFCSYKMSESRREDSRTPHMPNLFLQIFELVHSLIDEEIANTESITIFEDGSYRVDYEGIIFNGCIDSLACSVPIWTPIYSS